MRRTTTLIALGLLAGCAARAESPPEPVRPGQALYQKHCAECHGEQAVHPTAEAPDLRRLDSFCRRLTDPALQTHCREDVERYFLRSVREGKVRAGVVHMPPWEGRLTLDEMGSIRQFILTRPAPVTPPRPAP
jgi:hypothetical protein